MSANIKPVSRSRSWMITQRESEITLEELQSRLSKYTYVGQLEEGSNKDDDGVGYRHYQIYIENQNPIRFDTLKKLLPTAHLEARRGSVKQAYEYCTKEETRIGESFSNGDIDVASSQGARSDLERLREMVFQGIPVGEIIINEPAAARYEKHLDRLYFELMAREHSKSVRLNLNVEYLWGRSGSGKTSGVYDEHGFDDVYRIVDYKHPFDEYSGQSVLVIDEYHSQFSMTLLLNLLDIYPLQLPSRYKNKWAGFTKVYIISNKSLEEQHRDVQLDSPETFNALRRRIHTIRFFE